MVIGESYLQCSHRSELCGLVGAVKHIRNICKKYDIQQGLVEIVCDGLEAYKIASRYELKHTTNMGHFDISTCLHELLKQNTLTWSFRHVKGHQDDMTNIANIDIWGQLNMVADVYAKMALWRHINNVGDVFQMKQVYNAIPSIQI